MNDETKKALEDLLDAMKGADKIEVIKVKGGKIDDDELPFDDNPLMKGIGSLWVSTEFLKFQLAEFMPPKAYFQLEQLLARLNACAYAYLLNCWRPSENGGQLLDSFKESFDELQAYLNHGKNQIEKLKADKAKDGKTGT